MHYSLSLALGRPYAGILDQDATNYIAAVTSAGATVTSTQKYAINDFILAEKSASRWTGLKRFYLPVWGVAAANAICMKSLTSGTFNGGVTHGSGFVQGDGATGYFDFGASPSGLGLANFSVSQFVLHQDVGVSGNRMGVIAASSADQCRMFFSTSITTNIGGTPTAAITSVTRDGIFVATRASATSLRVHRRHSGGFGSGAEVTTTATGTIPSLNYYALVHNNNGVPINFSTNITGLYGISDAVADPSAFTLNLKTLWETVTGLTLP